MTFDSGLSSSSIAAPSGDTGQVVEHVAYHRAGADFGGSGVGYFGLFAPARAAGATGRRCAERRRRRPSRAGTQEKVPIPPSQRLDPFLFALSIGASSFHISLRKERHVFCCFVPFFIDVQVLFFNLVEFIHFPPVPLIHLIGFFAGFNLKEVQWFVFFSFSLTPSPSYSILVVLLADSALF